MEKKNIRNPQGRRLVGARTESSIKNLRRNVIYSPDNNVPMWEEDEDEEGRLIIAFRKKQKGQDAIFAYFTSSQLVDFIIEREKKHSSAGAGPNV